MQRASRAQVPTFSFWLLCAICLLVLINHQASAQVDFISARLFPASQAGNGASLTLTGDFNGDGKSDLITIATGNNPVISILVGNGDGTFQPPVTIATGPFLPTTAAATGDFNGDGKLDFVCSLGGYANTILVVLGNGDGTFQAPITTNVAAPPDLTGGLAVEDFNHDGKSDVALTATAPQQGAGTVLILFSNGDGTFATPVSYGTSSISDRLVVGDFNGDGKPDLAGDLFENPIVVLLGNGDGTFRSAPSVNRGCGQTDALVVGDFNGDGKDDLAVDSAVFLSNGDGTFQPPMCNTITSPNVVADFNRDGILDILSVANNLGASADTVEQIFLGKGDGTFRLASSFPSSLTPSDPIDGLTPIPAADFNGDGKLDLAGPSSGSNVLVILGNGDGTFRTAVAIPSEFTNPFFQPLSFIEGDLNNDGRADLILFGAGREGGSVATQLGYGNGTFHNPSLFPSGGDLTTAGILGDFNNDGKPDLVTMSNSPQIAVLLGNGDGTFKDAAFYTPAEQPLGLGVGDFNGDGNQDIVVPGQIFLGNGDGTFNFPVTINAGGFAMVVGDVNGDGKPDIVQAPPAGNAVDTCLNNGNLSFTCIDTSLAGAPTAIALADLNKDGKLDIAVGIGNQVQVLLGNGDGTFQSAGIFPVPSGANVIAVADLNADGFLDLAFSGYANDFDGGNGVSVLLGNGDGTFQPAVTYDGQGQVVAADLNGDGKPDLTAFGPLGLFLNLIFNTVGLSPGALVNPSSLTFTSEPVDSTSPSQKVILQNSGGAALSISRIAIIGLNAGDFAQTNNCGSSLAANASCTISVTFTPSASGTRTGALSITDAVGNQTVSLMGTGAPSLALGIPAGGSNSATVAAGGTATYNLAIGGGGLSGTATLTCTGAPTGATCTLPSTININSGTSSPFTVSVSTTARNNAAIQRRGSSLAWFWAMGLIGMVWLPLNGGRRRDARGILLALSILLLTFLVSCGGGSGGGTGSGGTPAGTYTLTVTATMGSTHQSQTLKLTVN